MHGSAQSEGLAGPRFDNLLWTCAKFSAIQVKFLPTFYVVTYSWWIISSHFHGTMEGTSPSRKSSRLPGMANVDPTCWQGRRKKTFDIGISSLPSCGQPRWTWILNASGVRSAEHNQVPEHHLSMSHKCMPWWPKPKYTDMWYVTKLAQSNCRVLCSFHCRLDPEARAPVEEAGPWEIRKVVLSFKKGQPVNRLTFLDLVLTASASSENRIMRCWACCCLHSLVIQGLVPSKTQYLSRCPFSVLLDDTAPTSSNVSTVWQLLWGTLPGLEQSPCLKHCSVQSAHSKAPESVRKASGHQLTSSTNAADFVFWEPNPSKGKRSLVVAVALEHASDLKTSICESWANQKTAWAGSTKADLAVWASKDRRVRRLPGCQADYPNPISLRSNVWNVWCLSPRL